MKGRHTTKGNGRIPRLLTGILFPLVMLAATSRTTAQTASGIITTYAGFGTAVTCPPPVIILHVACYLVGAHGFSGDGGPATSALLNRPAGIAMDAAGNLFIADSGNNRIRKVTSDGIIFTVVGSPGLTLNYPQGVAVDAMGNLFIGDGGNDRIRKVTPAGVFSTIAGGGAGGQPGFSGDGGPATQAQLSSGLFGVALDAAGDIFIADSNNNRIREVTPQGFISTVAGNGNAGFSGDGGPATSASLQYPSDVTIDPSGNLYIADSLNHRVRKVTPDGVISTVGTGFEQPGFVATDALGNLFVSDEGKNVVWEVSPDGLTSIVAGNGARLVPPSGDGGPATSAVLGTIGGLAVDPAGNLFIAGDSRIRKVFQVFQPTATRSFGLTPSSFNYQTTISPTGPMAVGYGTVQWVTGTTTPSGIAVYSYRPNGVLVSETAVPASPLRQSGRIYAESSGAVRTGIAIANPNDQDAAISFYFTDTDGVNLNDGTMTLPAHQQTAVFLDEQPYFGTSAAQTFTFNSSVPVSAVALRSYINERSEALMTTLPVAPVLSNASSSAVTIVLPHFAAGGGWTTQVLLVNPTDQVLSGSVNMDAAYTYAVAPRSSVKITSASSDLLQTGNIVITAAQGSGLPIASSVFSFVNNGITVTETGIATTGVAPGFQVFAESDSGQRLQTGIAVANTATTAAKVQFELLSSTGQSTAYIGSATLDPNGHVALFLNQIPGMQQVPSSLRGVLHISSNTPISAIGLRTRYNERGDFLISTTPAIADNAPSSSDEYVFPQVVSGSGYSTDFILMNPTGTSQGTLSLKSQAGTELPLFAP